MKKNNNILKNLGGGGEFSRRKYFSERMPYFGNCAHFFAKR